MFLGNNNRFHWYQANKIELIFQMDQGAYQTSDENIWILFDNK